MPQTQSNDSDAALAKSWAAGDERGYEALVRRYSAMVYSRCRRTLGDADADDATQAVFLVLARRREAACASPALAAWLSKVCDNVVRNAKRDEERRRRAERAMPPPSPASEETTVPLHEVQSHLDACFTALPKVQRDAVRLHHLAGHTLAEVAAFQKTGESTVIYRLKCGLARLRKSLLARGVTLSAAGLLGFLQAEEVCVVPQSVLAHLNALSPTAHEAGLTTSVSERVQRWSRQGISTMTRIALIGAAALFVGGAITSTIVSVEAKPSPKPKEISSKSSTAPAVNPAYPGLDADTIALLKQGKTIDPEKASTWVVARWNNGARTVERIKRLPEMALLPPEGEAALAKVGLVKEGVLLMDLYGKFSKSEREGMFRSQEQQTKMSPKERLETMKKMFSPEEMEKIAMAERQKGTLSKGHSSSIQPVFSGWLEFSSPDGLTQLDKVFYENAAKIQGDYSLTQVLMPKSWPSSADKGWVLKFGTREISFVHQGNRLNVSEKDGETPPKIVAVRSQKAEFPNADLELDVFQDPGTTNGQSVKTLGSLLMTVTDDGLRLSIVQDYTNFKTVAQTIAGPRINLARFDAVPAKAFFAASLAMRPKDTKESVFWQSMIQGILIPMELKGNAKDMDSGEVMIGVDTHGKTDARIQPPAKHLPLTRTILSALENINGEVMVWLEPGLPVPTTTLEADLPKTDFDALVVALDRKTESDGSVKFAFDGVSLTLGYQNNRLILTTNPGGLTAIDRSGGFSKQPEIVRAIAALPPGKHAVCALMRPSALVATAQPFVAMFAPDWNQRVMDYKTRMETSKAYGFLTIGADERGVKVEAAGVMSIIAAAIIGTQATNPLARIATMN